MNKTAIVFLTKQVHQETINFAMKLGTHFDVFIVEDSTYIWETETINSYKKKNVEIIRIEDNVCVESGYVGTNIVGSTHIPKQVLAIDKFLLEFCEHRLDYNKIWVFEDDVFIPSVEIILQLHDKYKNYDLVTPNHFEKNDRILDWHWKHIFDKIEKPYFYSMVCGMMVSRKMLHQIKKYVAANKRLFYLEVMFNTLAHQSGLKIKDAFELKSVVWQGRWAADEFLLLPNNVFHPLKDLDKYESYRSEIKALKKSNYQPKNNLPNFITDLMP